MTTEAERRLSEHLRRGDLLRIRGRLQEAEAEYKAAVELESTHGDAHYKLFDLYTEMGREEEAFRELEFVSAVESNLDREEYLPFLSETETENVHLEPESKREKPTITHSRSSESLLNVQDVHKPRVASIPVPIQDEPQRRMALQGSNSTLWRQRLRRTLVMLSSAVLIYAGWRLFVEAPRQGDQLAKQDLPSSTLPLPITEEAAAGKKEELQDNLSAHPAETAEPPGPRSPQPEREPQPQAQSENSQRPQPEPQSSSASLPQPPPTSSAKEQERKKSPPNPLAQERRVAKQKVPTKDGEKTEELPLGKYKVLRDTRLFREPDLDTDPVAWLREGTKVNVVGTVGSLWLKVESRRADRPPGYLRRYDAEAIHE